MREVKIGSRVVGSVAPPFVIAEAGINHNGDPARALEMIRVAKAAGADAVKFQTFVASELVGDPTLTFTYRSQGTEVTEPMLAMFGRYELSKAVWRDIARACRDEGIVFLSTPQNRTDLELLLELDVPAVKIGSDDFSNLPLLRSYASTNLPLILSCGMSDLGDVYAALETVGALDGYPTVLLLCTSQYPTPPADVHIRKLDALAAAFPRIVLGFSDHTTGPVAAVLAIAKGARVFEKHFTLSHDLPGPDHWFSEDPDGLRDWVASIRTADAMLGDALVRPTEMERRQRSEFRRVMVAARDLCAGDILEPESIVMRRISGGAGLAPALLEYILDRPASRDYRRGDPIIW
jgi:N,N'-diacetyllegionaminate synthase